MAITENDVFRAADELVKDGIKPTQASIRDRIGGSYSVIGPALKNWRDLYRMPVTRATKSPWERGLQLISDEREQLIKRCDELEKRCHELEIQLAESRRYNQKKT